MTPSPDPPGNKEWRIEIRVAEWRVLAIAGLVTILGLLSLPLWAGRAELRLGAELLAYLALAQFWNLMAGYAGLVSVGQQAWVGLGGYVLFALCIWGGVHPLAAIPLAGLAAAAVAAPAGILLLRLNGAYFAIGAWVVAEVLSLTVSQSVALGGGSGLSLPPEIVRSIAATPFQRDTLIYCVSLVLGLGSVLMVYGLLRRDIGLALMAVRDGEGAAASLGVDTWRLKFGTWLIAAFGAGCAGGLLFLQKLRISPAAAFSVQDWTAFVIFIVVIGGVGSIEGPIIGVLLFFLLRETLAELGAWYLVILGLTAIVVMLTAPRGLWGLLSDRFGWRLFPITRSLIHRDGSLR